MEDMKARFLDDVKEHEMTILKDDGVYRHVRYKRPGSGAFWFDIVTWPGYLAISGDMGEYIFSRIEDMFNFFETPNGELGINCGYWCEKIKSISRFGSNDGKLNEFYAQGTWESIEETAEEVIEDKDELAQFKSDLLNCDTDQEAINTMEHHDFDASYEYLCYEPTFHTEWILYAICWGIMEYEKEKNDRINPI